MVATHRLLLQHLPGDTLRKKERATQVGVDDPVVAFFGGFEDVGAILRRDARVIHQEVDTPERFERLGDEFLVVGGVGHICLHDDCFAARLLDHLPTIINMASLSSYAATHERSQYCIAKAGLSMMTDLYAARLAPEGVLVLEIRPGIINTDMARNAKDKYDKLIFEGDLLPMKRWGEPEDIAKAVLAITDGCFNYSPGAVLDVDGGFNIRRL